MEGLTLAAVITLGVTACITGFIGYMYSKQLQNEKFQDDYRQKAKIVAELFSIWHQGPYSTRVLTPEDFAKLNQLIWECTFWLSDDLVIDINNRLQNVQGAKDLKEILVDVREYLNPKLGRIDWQNIIHF